MIGIVPSFGTKHTQSADDSRSIKRPNRTKPTPDHRLDLDSDIKQLKIDANIFNGARTLGIHQEAVISLSQHSLL